MAKPCDTHKHNRISAVSLQIAFQKSFKTLDTETPGRIQDVARKHAGTAMTKVPQFILTHLSSLQALWFFFFF